VICSGLLVLFAFASFAQEATAVRSVNLRPDPSTANSAVKLLQSGTRLTLLDPTTHDGFYHVKTEDDEEGWVWSKNITVSGNPSPQPSTSAICDDSLWDHVYNPQRLIVKQKCIAVTGTTVERRREGMLMGFGTKPMAILTGGSSSILVSRTY
jgi:hypothetical protein